MGRRSPKRKRVFEKEREKKLYLNLFTLKNYKTTFNKLTFQRRVSHGKIPIAFPYFSLNLHSLDHFFAYFLYFVLNSKRVESITQPAYESICGMCNGLFL